MTNSKHGLLYILFCIALVATHTAWADTKEDYVFNLTLKELLNHKVTTVSRYEELLKNSPGVATVLTQDDIRLFGAKNLIDIINLLPSTLVLSNNLFPNDQIVVRGDISDTADHVLLLINGYPFRTTALRTGASRQLLYTFPVENIKRVEYVRSPGSALYGPNSFSGVINIITLSPEESKGAVSITTGSFGERKFNVSKAIDTDVFSGKFHFYAQQSDGWDYSYQLSDGSTDNNNLVHDSTALFAEGHVYRFSFTLFKDKLEGNTFGHTSTPIKQRFKDDSTFINTKYSIDISEHWKTNAQLSLSRLKSLTFTSNEWNFDWENQLKLGKSQAVWGLNVIRLNDVKSVPENPVNLKITPWDTTQYTIYGQVNYFLKDTQFILGGQWLKAEFQSSTFVPRLGIVQALNDHWTLKALYNEAYRAPNAIETQLDLSFPPFSVTGNPRLKPERVKTTELQLAYQKRNYYMALTLYDIRQDELIVDTRDLANLTISYDNLDRREYSGAEFELNYLHPNWNIQGSISYQENSGSNAQLGLKEIKNISTAPHVLAKIGAAYHRDNWSLGVFDNIVGKYVSNEAYLAPGKTAKVNPDAGGNHIVTANWHLLAGNYVNIQNDRLTFTLNAYNLLNQEIWANYFFSIPESTQTPSINTYPLMPERSFYLSMNYRW